jgi:type IV pilus assembly protein PilX
MGYNMREKGFVLIISLIFLVLMTMLGLAMFSGFIGNQMIAGNHREKSRAFDAAQTATNNAEYWLLQVGNAIASDDTLITGSVCSAMTSTPVVCSNALVTPTTLPWSVGVNYTPSGMSISSTGGVGTYAVNPTYYIQYLGLAPSGGGGLYQVTAAGQGGDANSAAVLQSVFQVSCKTTNLSSAQSKC